ncbi:acyl-CoA thioesterase [Primorskyibacter flagellatus]|uniref:Acyl-CoA thioesterase FadM n=1 Tax=Primorskyibacter flagellatus TaxID=1387277 RepID=A0A1W2A3G0_9RHOB|nr:acyl-CoA thioesterase [Primorskyibacter flagellatus]SMC54982.1 Acyl-CoA thioesterase FadM [Primorskyibacter flagellatus]
MYPFIRMAKELVINRKASKLSPTGTHVSRHMCLPWDIDLWAELNNGRTLTIYDLGRIPLAQRTGLIGVLRRQRWGLTVAGVSVRYRRRIRMFDVVEMRSRLVGWDEKFIYLDQSMWRKDGACANQGLYRTAVTGRDGIIPPAQVAAALGANPTSPPLPDWIRAWITAEDQRPWPPKQD